MIDFNEKTRISKKANEILENILLQQNDYLKQLQEIQKIDELEVAKVIIQRLIAESNKKN